MLSAIRDPKGKVSAMRLGFFACLGAGAVLVGAGVIGLFLGLEGTETAMATGAGMMTGSGFAKALQAAQEAKNPHTRSES
jgi:hypothetical protein